MASTVQENVLHQVPFSLAYATSLQNQQEQTEIDGPAVLWKSGRSCHWPQELWCEIRSDYCGGTVINEIQLVAHQLHTPRTVEIFAGHSSADSLTTVFTNVGYVRFSDQPPASGMGREALIVKLPGRGVEATAFRIVVHDCVRSGKNRWSQASFTSLSFLGRSSSRYPLTTENNPTPVQQFMDQLGLPMNQVRPIFNSDQGDSKLDAEAIRRIDDAFEVVDIGRQDGRLELHSRLELELERLGIPVRFLSLLTLNNQPLKRRIDCDTASTVVSIRAILEEKKRCEAYEECIVLQRVCGELVTIGENIVHAEEGRRRAVANADMTEAQLCVQMITACQDQRRALNDQYLSNTRIAKTNPGQAHALAIGEATDNNAADVALDLTVSVSPNAGANEGKVGDEVTPLEVARKNNIDESSTTTVKRESSINQSEIRLDFLRTRILSVLATAAAAQEILVLSSQRIGDNCIDAMATSRAFGNSAWICLNANDMTVVVSCLNVIEASLVELREYVDVRILIRGAEAALQITLLSSDSDVVQSATHLARSLHFANERGDDCGSAQLKPEEQTLTLERIVPLILQHVQPGEPKLRNEALATLAYFAQQVHLGTFAVGLVLAPKATDLLCELQSKLIATAHLIKLLGPGDEDVRRGSKHPLNPQSIRTSMALVLDGQHQEVPLVRKMVGDVFSMLQKWIGATTVATLLQGLSGDIIQHVRKSIDDSKGTSAGDDTGTDEVPSSSSMSHITSAHRALYLTKNEFNSEPIPFAPPPKTKVVKSKPKPAASRSTVFSHNYDVPERDPDKGEKHMHKGHVTRNLEVVVVEDDDDINQTHKSNKYPVSKRSEELSTPSTRVTKTETTTSTRTPKARGQEAGHAEATASVLSASAVSDSAAASSQSATNSPRKKRNQLSEKTETSKLNEANMRSQINKAKKTKKSTEEKWTDSTDQEMEAADTSDGSDMKGATRISRERDVIPSIPVVAEADMPSADRPAHRSKKRVSASVAPAPDDLLQESTLHAHAHMQENRNDVVGVDIAKDSEDTVSNKSKNKHVIESRNMKTDPLSEQAPDNTAEAAVVTSMGSKVKREPIPEKAAVAKPEPEPTPLIVLAPEQSKKKKKKRGWFGFR